MMEYVFITDPTPRQIAEITALYRQAGWWDESEPDDPDLVARLVAGSHLFLAALADRRMVGMGRAISDRASDAYIQDVTVEEEWRGQGIARALVETLVRALSRDGIGWIGLIAERGTGALYQGLGFEAMRDAMPLLKKD